MTTDVRDPVGVGPRRSDRLPGVIVAVLAVLFAVQTGDSFLADLPTVGGPSGVAVVGLALASVAGGIAAVLSRREPGRRLLAAFLAYLAALAIWPLAVHGPVPAGQLPWLAAIAPLPLAWVAIAARRWTVALACSVLVAADVTVVLAAAGRCTWADAAMDGGSVLAAGALLTAVVGGARRGRPGSAPASRPPAARHARSGRAAEEARARTDAMVHDRVLTTFLSAAFARSPEDEELAAKMARTALRLLSREADPGTGPSHTPLARVLEEMAPRLAPVIREVDLRLTGLERVLLPSAVAETMVEAMTQAMVDSVERAGPDAVRTASIEPFGVDGVRIVVQDDGVGFDPATVPVDGTGVRPSVVDRLRRIDGRARVESAPGRGTRVELIWGADLEIVRAEDSAGEAVPA